MRKSSEGGCDSISNTAREAGGAPGYDEDPYYSYQDKAGNRYLYIFGLTY